MKFKKYIFLILILLFSNIVLAGPILSSSNVDLRPLKDINLGVGETTNIVLTVYSGTSQVTYTTNIGIDSLTITDFTGNTISGTTSFFIPGLFISTQTLTPTITPISTGQFTITAIITENGNPTNTFTSQVNGFIFSNTGGCTDFDGDGYQAQSCGGRDVNDNNPAVNIGGSPCTDSDGDSYGAQGTDLSQCSGSTTQSDCNNNDNSIYPNAPEICDGKDNQCSGNIGYGQIDENVKITYYRDIDLDNYGNNSVTSLACTSPAGYVVNNNDCSDNNNLINPGVTDVCGNGIDENCDGSDASCGGGGGSGGGGSSGGAGSESCSSNIRELTGEKSVVVREACIISFSYENTRYETKVENVNSNNLTLSLLGNEAVAKINNQARLSLTSAKDLIFSYDKLDYGKVTITLSTGEKQATTQSIATPLSEITPITPTETTPTAPTTETRIQPKTPTGAAVVSNIKKTATGIGVTLGIILLGSVVYYVFLYKKRY